mmetsp:Transcript_64217/g.191709  ORF Transcript_64217/g.191709 Transcript_64217/m.191709 type:complete len:265 (+) Transcript_64217:1144-1938(+)
MVLDLRDDPHARAHLRVGRHEARAYLAHVRRLADEGREDHVDVLADAPREVGLVLLRQRRQVDVHLGQVAPLLRAERRRVDHLALDRRVVDELDHLEAEQPVVDEDDAAHLHHLGQVDVVHVQRALVARLLERRVDRHRDRVARLQVDRRAPVALDQARPDLGPLGVERDRAQPAVERRVGHALPQVGHAPAVLLVRAVREVHPHHVHARHPQHRQLVHRLALRADGANDARTAERGRRRIDVELRTMLDHAERLLCEALRPLV